MTSPQRESRPPRDSKSNLYEAALAAVKDRQEAAQRPQARPRTRVRWVTLLLLLGLIAAILLLVRPVWLVGPKAPPAESESIVAASFRLTLLRERQRVFDYTKRHGHLPATLVEAGSPRSDIRFQTTGPLAFNLSARAGDSLITLHSSDSLGAFLGESLKAIRNRAQYP